MRRFTAFCLAAYLALSIPVAALAQIAGNHSAEGLSVSDKGTVIHIESTPVDLEELVFSGGTAAQINTLDENGNVQLKEGNYVRYIDRVNLPDFALALYEALEEGADGDGKADILIDVTQAQRRPSGYAILLTQFSGSYSNNTELMTIARANHTNAGAYAWAVVGSFDRDHPEVFWLSDSWSTSYSLSANGKTYTQSIYLTLKDTASGRDVRNDGYTDPAVLRAAIAERDASVQAILNKLPSTAVTDAEKMRYFNEWLTHNNEYNTAVDSGDIDAAWDMSWECISALQGNTGKKGPVCEGYARAFQVLCMKSGIPCVLVSGDTQGTHTGTSGHMWNCVQLGNDWYGVDVTWNDPSGSKAGKVSGHERENYLFVGADTVAVTGGRTFLAEHPVENEIFTGGVRFINGPVLSKTAYSGGHTHTYGAPVFRWDANGKSATAVFTCTADASHTMELPANVTSTVKIKATCESMGTTTYTATVNRNGTSYSATKDVRDIPALGHDWGDWVQTKAPTEIEKGEATRTCRRDPGHTETKEPSATGTHVHILTLVPAKEPNETEAGNKAYYICSGCDKWFEDAEGKAEITDKSRFVIQIITAGLLGDINGSGTIDAIDYMLLKRYVLGTYAFTDEQKAVSDVNRSGTIDAIDYMLLKRQVLGTYVIP